MSLDKIHSVYFIGIGGIGMSALARYFNDRGKQVAGYDRTSTPLTQKLEAEGMEIHYEDNLALVPSAVQQPEKQDQVLVVITPAIPKDHQEWKYFIDNGFTIKKRAEVLGLITRQHYTMAIGGTHGKTTTSAILTHILHHSGVDCTAFLGGIAANYQTNYIGSKSLHAKVVAEADEYDRSFLQLTPEVGVITSTDPDHLDIYGKHDAMQESFIAFAGQVKEVGALYIKAGLPIESKLKQKYYTYAVDQSADFRAYNVKVDQGYYQFDLDTPEQQIAGLKLGIPGRHNVENATVASAVALSEGVQEDALRNSLATFNGVKRRFEYIIRQDSLVFIDDYAHHPTELEATIRSARELYPNKRMTVVFQPHLYSRTRDFVDGFAQSLSLADELILLDIYPARELPIEGVSSQIILDQVSLDKKQVCAKHELLDRLKDKDLELLLTLGAGDIDQLVDPIKEWCLQREGGVA